MLSLNMYLNQQDIQQKRSRPKYYPINLFFIADYYGWVASWRYLMTSRVMIKSNTSDIIEPVGIVICRTTVTIVSYNLFVAYPPFVSTKTVVSSINKIS